MTEGAELEAALARAHAAEAKVEALEIRLGLRSPRPKAREARRPKRFTMERGADTLGISWRWSPDWFLVVVVLVWNGVLTSIFIDEWRELIAGWRSLLVVPHVVVGIGLGVMAIASFVNRTTIRAHDGLLEVTHGPIKIRKRRAVATNDVQQLRPVKTGEATYSVMAVFGDDRKRTLLEGLEDDESHFLVVTFEEHLAIEPKPLSAE